MHLQWRPTAVYLFVLAFPAFSHAFFIRSLALCSLAEEKLVRRRLAERFFFHCIIHIKAFLLGLRMGMVVNGLCPSCWVVHYW
jgi:hypothetical protein